MNLTEQIKAFDSFDFKFNNKKNLKSINRLLTEATMINTSINNNNTKTNQTSKRLEELKIITERYKLPKLEAISDDKQKVKFNLDPQRRVTRVNLYGYESIQEESFPVIKRLSPKQKEDPTKITNKPQIENLIKKPSLKSLKFNNEKKGIVFKNEVKVIDQNKGTSMIVNQPIESIQISEKTKEVNNTISSTLSEDANYAMLKTYEDMLYFDLLSIYPESGNLSRTNTKDFIQIPRKLPTKLPPIRSRLSEQSEIDKEELNKQKDIRSHQIKISQHLEKAMLISDIIKKTKGELTTTNKPAQFKNLVGVFNEWKNNWQQSILS